MARIYISSTFEDLERERRSAWAAVRRLEHHAIGMEAYGAFSDRPLHKCTADVRCCDIYVGILGWRYGFVPDEGGGKSITHLEYEAAAREGIPCLIYVTKQDYDEWSRSRMHDENPASILGFRQLVVDAHGLFHFQDADDLEKQLLADLVRRVGNGRRFPELLPYACDREAQLLTISNALRSSEENSTLVFVLHGAREQLPGKFIDCLKVRYLARLLGRRPEDLRVIEHRVRWPTSSSEELMESEVIGWLGESVCNHLGASREDLAAMFARLQAPVIVSVCLPLDRWQPLDRQRLKWFADFWLKWNIPYLSEPVLVVVYVQYPEPQRRWFSFWPDPTEQRNQAVAAAIAELDRMYQNESRVTVLPQLQNVLLSDVDTWSRGDEVRQIVAGGDMETDLQSLFEDQEALSMQALGEALKAILLQHFDARR